MESRNNRERFVALAEARVTRTIKDLRLLGNLANRSNYSYSERDVAKIVGVLEKELRDLKKRFRNKGKNSEIVFTLEP